MAPYEALYGLKCRTPVCWTELNEHKVTGPDIVKDTEEKVQVIRERLKAASDRQKSYANLKRRDIAYEVGDKGLLESIAVEENSTVWKKWKIESEVHRAI